MAISIKSFSDLGLQELYELLQLRSEVFVIEQDCIYQDIDGKDQDALHVLGYEENRLVAYTRCFPPGKYFKEASIGRVLVRETARRKSLGHEILKASIKAIEDRFESSEIKLSAQTYLINFYEMHGFHQTGEGYLEDGIPHIAMSRKI